MLSQHSPQTASDMAGGTEDAAGCQRGIPAYGRERDCGRVRGCHEVCWVASWDGVGGKKKVTKKALEVYRRDLHARAAEAAAEAYAEACYDELEAGG